MQKYANLVELEKCCQTHIFLQICAFIQLRTSPPKICKILIIFSIVGRGAAAEHGLPNSVRGADEAGAGAAAGSALTTGGAATCGSTVGGMEDDGLVRFFDNKFQMKSS